MKENYIISAFRETIKRDFAGRAQVLNEAFDGRLQSLRQESSECSDYYNLYNVSAEYLQTVNCCRGRENGLLNYSRHLLYTYFAGTDRYVGMRLGEAALAGAFDLEHPCYASLKECLQGLN